MRDRLRTASVGNPVLMKIRFYVRQTRRRVYIRVGWKFRQLETLWTITEH